MMNLALFVAKQKVQTHSEKDLQKSKVIKIKYFPADWNTYGKSAGFVRNIEMAENATALIAFWDGKSSGTKHMIETAKKI